MNSAKPSLASSDVLHTIVVKKVEVILDHVKRRAERTTVLPLTGRTQEPPHLKSKQGKRGNKDLVILEKTRTNQFVKSSKLRQSRVMYDS